MTERTRYDNGNTLVTIRDEEMIFFGISRCNYDEGEVFKKAKGRMIARNRALKAQGEPVGRFEGVAGMVMGGRWGLRGACPVDQIAALLTYFQDTDNRLYQESGDYRRFVKKLRATLSQSMLGDISSPWKLPPFEVTDMCKSAEEESDPCADCCGGCSK